MSARLLRGLLNARCAVPDAGVPGRCFPPVSWFFFTAELQRSVHSARLLCMGAGVTAWHRVEAHNAALFAFSYCTINWMVWARVLCWFDKDARGGGSNPDDKKSVNATENLSLKVRLLFTRHDWESAHSLISPCWCCSRNFVATNKSCFC